MEPIIMDPTWALLTLLLTALVGLGLALVLMVLLESRRVTKNAKRGWCVVGFAGFMVWLFTIGDPHSSVNMETLYYRSINYLPETRFTKVLKRGMHTNQVALQTNQLALPTNAPITVSLVHTNR